MTIMVCNSPAVSVIVPVYNVESWLNYAVESLLTQTCDDWEAILIDDGSTDRSGEIAVQWAHREERIRIFNRPRAGLSETRNHGIEHARGGFLAFLDSDDEFEPSALERLLDAAQRYDASIVIGAHRRIGMSSTARSSSSLPVPFRGKPDTAYGPRDAVRAYLRREITPMVWDSLYRRELFTTLRFPTGRIHEDVFLKPRLLMASPRTVRITDCVYRYRVRSNSITTTLDAGRIDLLRAHNSFFTVLGTFDSNRRLQALARSLMAHDAADVGIEACRSVQNDHGMRRISRLRWWRRQIYREVPRGRLFRVLLDTEAPVRRRVLAGLILIDMRLPWYASRVLCRLRAALSMLSRACLVMLSYISVRDREVPS